MSKVEMLRTLLNARLSAAVEEIAVVFASTIAEYEEELCRSKQENERQRQQLNSVFSSKDKARKADVRKVLPLEQQEWSSMMEQKKHESPKYEDVEEAAAKQLELPCPHVILKTEYDGKKSRSDDNECSSSSQRVTRDADGTSQEDSRIRPPSNPCSAAPDDEHPKVKHLPPEQQDDRSTTCVTLTSQKPRVECSSPTVLIKQIGFENGWTEEADKWKIGFKPEEKNDTIDCPSTGVARSQVDLDQREANEWTQLPNPLETSRTHWKCSECGKTFGAKKNLRSHMIIHLADKSDPSITPYPGFLTDAGANPGEKPDLSFSDRSRLVKSIKAQISEKRFKCSVCGHRFSIKGNLLTHMRVHTGEKPFPCSICGIRFSQKISLAHHIRTHTGERPYSCPVCKKSFSHPTAQKRHIKIHTGEKFFCPDCGQAFSRKYTLTKHTQLNKCRVARK
ncbi:uncharacterized protein LOC144064222 isoform X1 [Stigmatopora argus]